MAENLAQSDSKSLRIGQYNLLCPVYGVKWGEREACLDWKSKDDHGGSNWSLRWPALLRNISRCHFDVLTLEEAEDCIKADCEAGFTALGMKSNWFAHPGRQDCLGIAWDPKTLEMKTSTIREWPKEEPKASSGRMDFMHVVTGKHVRVLVTHQRGGKAEQLQDLFEFAHEDMIDGGIIVIGGDWNEDFGKVGGCKLAEQLGFEVLNRDASAGEPSVSRPSHKQDPSQTSGKGMIDWVFVKGAAELERDSASRDALLLSHAACEETGEWPSDHGMEALNVHVTAKL